VLVREQIAASVEQNNAVREAARAQVQPIVFANAFGAAIRGVRAEFDAGEGDVTFPYHLSNEGTGVALNVRHGVEIDGADYAFGAGMEFRAVRPGESLPPLGEGANRQLSQNLSVVVPEHSLPANWSTLSRTYWARFENVFGDRPPR
jgi:hypothetical protein